MLIFQDWQIAAIQKGINAADRGAFVDHAELKAKWQKRLADQILSENVARKDPGTL